jgi:protein TonB
MAHVYTQPTWTPRRFVALAAAVAVNAGFLIVLANGLEFRVPGFKQPEPMAVVEIQDQPAPIEDIPPPPEIQTTPQDVVVPEPDVQIDLPPPPEETVAATTPDPAPTVPVAPPADRELQADSRYPLTPPVYPAVSRRLNEQGTVLLMIYVLPDGRIGDVRVKRSSGFPRLDQAALEAARKNWRFQAATSGGTPIAAWGQYAVKFQLTTT